MSFFCEGRKLYQGTGISIRKKMKEYRSSRELIVSLFKNLSDCEDSFSFANSWESIVGVDLSAHSRILDIKNGNLIIEVDHSVWIQELQFRKTKILKKIQKQYPALSVKKMSFQMTYTKQNGASEQSARNKRTAAVETPDEKEKEEFADALNRLKNSLKRDKTE